MVGNVLFQPAACFQLSVTPVGDGQACPAILFFSSLSQFRLPSFLPLASLLFEQACRPLGEARYTFSLQFVTLGIYAGHRIYIYTYIHTYIYIYICMYREILDC